MKLKKCLFCGKLFKTSKEHKWYCSVECREKAQKESLRRRGRKYYWIHREECLKRNREWIRKNRERYIAKKREARERKRLELMRLKGNKCELCGYDEHPEILEFHHEGDKRYRGDYLHVKDFPIEKILLVCPNCHRLLHLKNGKVKFNEK